LIFVKNRVEAEIAELFWEVVWWNSDHTHLRSWWLHLLFWEHKRSTDEIWSISLKMLVEDDLVHGLGELKVYLTQESSGVRGALASELLGVLSHAEDTVDLLVIDLWDLMSWHVLDVEVVFEK